MPEISKARAKELEYWIEVITENASFLESRYGSAKWARDKIKVFRSIAEFLEEHLCEQAEAEAEAGPHDPNDKDEEPPF